MPLITIRVPFCATTGQGNRKPALLRIIGDTVPFHVGPLPVRAHAVHRAARDGRSIERGPGNKGVWESKRHSSATVASGPAKNVAFIRISSAAPGRLRRRLAGSAQTT